MQCVGSPTDCNVRKIARCVRSAIAEESASAGDALELGMRRKSSLSELIFDRAFGYRHQTEGDLPMCNPRNPFCIREHIDTVSLSMKRRENPNRSTHDWIDRG